MIYWWPTSIYEKKQPCVGKVGEPRRRFAPPADAQRRAVRRALRAGAGCTGGEGGGEGKGPKEREGQRGDGKSPVDVDGIFSMGE